MVNQSKSEFFAALVKQIRDSVVELKSVYDDIKHTSELAAGDFPCCMVGDGGDVSVHNITSTQDQLINVIIQILADSDTNFDQLRNLDEAVMDAINQEHTINGTCLICKPMNRNAPTGWDDTNKWMQRRYEARLRRDR